MNDKLSPVNDQEFEKKCCTEDNLAFQAKLWELFSKRAARYTAGDSTSIPVEIAKELLSSIYFTLGIENDSPDCIEKFLQIDLEQQYELEVVELERKINQGKALWEAACLSIPMIENISLKDTLKGIGAFWRRYDYRFFAHMIPCDIDYQLCHPVPDTLLGVDYINEYLKRLLIEQDFLRNFDPQCSINLLQRYCGDYKGLLINLYEPIATNVVGLTIVGGSIWKLGFSEEELKQIVSILDPLTKSKTLLLLKEAVEAACERLNINHIDAQRYLYELAEALFPRISAALSSGNLSGIFLSS